METSELKLQALSKHLGLQVVELKISSDDDCVIKKGQENYLVVSDDEADEKWEYELDYYLVEYIYPELDEKIKDYFDDEKWKTDARYDGRAHSLARYDGVENAITVNDYQTFFIYRIN